MVSPAAAELPNGISTPPTTAPGAPNRSPPTGSSTQNAPQSQSQPATISTSQSLSNGVNLAAHAGAASTSLTDAGTSKRPRDARLIHLLLANMGVNAYTERVPLQLMDFAYRYTSGVLSDALAYEPPTAGNNLGGKKKAAGTGAGAGNEQEDGVSLNALRTAVAARASYQFSAALPKEFMIEVANERNRNALPRVDREFGIRLPPERYCLTGLGWDVKDEWDSEVEQDEEEEEEEEEEGEEEADATMDGGPVGGDTAMSGMNEENEGEEEEEFEEVMGASGNRDVDMADG
ncbi:TFIID-31kDa-domain-containing protein [Delitschia confertaspora ATCC 74209]|uniref:TFIID-31kDa-domain-containing protein n=1 Tax=Delitschia confertaspora ATCC 74209 TaxID=1513339 RepID=A0A9P4JEK9_9PLEO|nr:TFIID-31kDa-domain-containing protein [Delitschia confertaspora ATCC 74209]